MDKEAEQPLPAISRARAHWTGLVAERAADQAAILTTMSEALGGWPKSRVVLESDWATHREVLDCDREALAQLGDRLEKPACKLQPVFDRIGIAGWVFEERSKIGIPGVTIRVDLENEEKREPHVLRVDTFGNFSVSLPLANGPIRLRFTVLFDKQPLGQLDYALDGAQPGEVVEVTVPIKCSGPVERLLEQGRAVRQATLWMRDEWTKLLDSLEPARVDFLELAEVERAKLNELEVRARESLRKPPAFPEARAALQSEAAATPTPTPPPVSPPPRVPPKPKRERTRSGRKGRTRRK